MPPPTADQGSQGIIQILLDTIADLQRQLKDKTTITTNNVPNTAMQVQISTPTNSPTKHDTIDELQGPNDPYQKALGHDDLSIKITEWAMDVIKTGVWPKSKIISGFTTDVTGVIQAEIERINKVKANVDDFGSLFELP